MRNPDSQFNHICNYINSISVGSTFTTKEYISAIGRYENVTSWKRYSKNPHYNCHQYKGYLKRAGFISQVVRGTWKVDRHIPEWFDFGHLSILLGYYKWDYENKRNITTYKGLNRVDIIAQLDEDTHRAMGLISSRKPKSLPKLYSANREAYDFFILRVKDLGITAFITKNELAAFIENIKWPGVKNDGTKPKFSINGNYSPIIDHLLADGIIEEKFDGYRYSYTVKNEKPVTVSVQRVKDTIETLQREIPEPKEIVVKEVSQPTLLDKLQAMEYALIQMTAQVKDLINEYKSK